MKIVILLLLVSFQALSNDIIYKETTGNSITINKYVITYESYGYSIKYKSFVNNVEKDIMELETDINYSTLKWKYVNNDAKCNLSAIRKDNIIILTGTFNNEKIEKLIKIDPSPWKQLFPFDIGNSLRQRKNETSHFWTITPKNLNILEFTAKIEDECSIKVKDSNIDTYHVKIGVAGIFSLFWSADSWFNKTDMSFVKYKGLNGLPNSPITIIELQ